eukprot:gnl/MRDRNA2_/MRDRNA2_119946_c0_seq1.p1 gnl/MRDRNA2_/MRDRNA2_119946_c0~~gnl/MRDRNA2_/MRDRNA2_119946_c0_seq1.p1  ORF type:complete len:268 (+),score=38.35 gnl/MRDRNA2_/MRDRNA2_119946_c0_seq1:77-880(+)
MKLIIVVCILTHLVVSLKRVESLKLLQNPTDEPWFAEPYHGVKIMCTGWKKTGTSSVRAAYEVLGITPTAGCAKCRTPDCMQYYNSAEDARGCCDHSLVAEVKERYSPHQLKFVHLERRPERWRKTVDLWLNKKGGFHKYYGKLMGVKYGTPEFYTSYEAHNAYIRNLFKDQPERLLILNLEDDDPVENMQKFCDFVGQSNHPACKQGFPYIKHEAKREKGYGFKKMSSSDWEYIGDSIHFGKMNSSDWEYMWDHMDENPAEMQDLD